MLGVFDLKKDKTLKNIQVLTDKILGFALLRDNKSAFFCDMQGNIRMMNWKAGANSGDDFEFDEKTEKIGNGRSESICLSKDEKYLFVASKALVSVFETMTRKVIKEFKLTHAVVAINLIKDGKKAIVAEENGNFTIIDTETLEISSIIENVVNGRELYTIAII